MSISPGTLTLSCVGKKVKAALQYKIAHDRNYADLVVDNEVLSQLPETDQRQIAFLLAVRADKTVVLCLPVPTTPPVR